MTRFLAHALLGAATLILAACGGDASAPAATGSDSQARFKAGQNYDLLASAIDAPANEVVEVFSYACPACAAIQPQVDEFKRERGDAVRLRYVPAEFQPAWAAFARAFHTAGAMGAQGRLHRAFFNAIYQRRLPVSTLEDLAGVAASAGVDSTRFIEVSRSPEVEAAMVAGREYVKQAQVDATPTFIVSGRYRVSTRQPTGATALEVVGWLLENQP